MRTGELLHTLVGSAGEPYWNTSIAFSPDGTRFASGSQRFDSFVCGILETREILHTLTGGTDSSYGGQGTIVFV